MPQHFAMCDTSQDICGPVKYKARSIILRFSPRLIFRCSVSRVTTHSPLAAPTSASTDPPGWSRLAPATPPPSRPPPPPTPTTPGTSPGSPSPSTGGSTSQVSGVAASTGHQSVESEETVRILSFFPPDSDLQVYAILVSPTTRGSCIG